MPGPDDIRQGTEWDATYEAFWSEVQYCNEDGATQLLEYDNEDDPIPTNMVTTSQHYGFYSRLPEGTEVLTFDLVNGEVVHHGDNHDRPDLPYKAQTMMRDTAGNYLTCLAGGGGILAHAKGSAPITLQTDAAQYINLLGQAFLGSLLAGEALTKGTTQAAAFTTWAAALSAFFGVWNTELNVLTGHSDGMIATYATNVLAALQTLQTALGTFAGTIATWTSTKHKLDA